MDDNQEKISYTGSNIEDIYIREDVTYREDYISTNDKIFFDVDELEKYLLYSSLAAVIAVVTIGITGFVVKRRRLKSASVENTEDEK